MKRPMNMLDDIRMFARFGLGLFGFLRKRPITLEEAKAIIQERFENRDLSFLRIVAKGVYGFAGSPYLPLFRSAGIELGDIRSMVEMRGLEETLLELRKAGVYVTFEEFKGRRPIVRNGLEIPVEAHHFDNPYLKGHYQTETGGSTGAGTRVTHDLDHLANRAPNYIVASYAHNVLNVPTCQWRGVLPDGSGFNNVICSAYIGNVPKKWFTPFFTRDLSVSKKFYWANQYVVKLGRMLGVAMPKPQLVRMDQAIEVARWAVGACKETGSAAVRTGTSMAVRVCQAAQQEGLDLTGVTFVVGGEAVTDAKRREITETGAKCVTTYFFVEAGAVGWGCARPADSNDLHFFKDAFALVQYPRKVPRSDITVDAFHFTTLLPTAPKLMLNVETDDYGSVDRRSCGCFLEQCGFKEHLMGVQSFRKLTGEGVTLIGSEMEEILESVLPARLGGNSLNYQLLEEEDSQGFTRLKLLVSPQVHIADENQIEKVFMEALGRSSVAAHLAKEIWTQAGTVRVERREPMVTARGKQMLLHVNRT